LLRNSSLYGLKDTRSYAGIDGEIVLKEVVVNGRGKGNVTIAPEMNMTDFRLTEAIFPRREPMRQHGNPWPRSATFY